MSVLPQMLQSDWLRYSLFIMRQITSNVSCLFGAVVKKDKKMKPQMLQSDWLRYSLFIMRQITSNVSCLFGAVVKKDKKPKQPDV